MGDGGLVTDEAKTKGGTSHTRSEASSDVSAQIIGTNHSRKYVRPKYISTNGVVEGRQREREREREKRNESDDRSV